MEARERFEAHWESFSGNARAINNLCMNVAKDDPATCQEILIEFQERYKALRDHLREEFEARVREDNFRVLAGR